MLEKFLKQTSFQDNEDYREHLEFIVPERFNFAYDVMDAWAEECPDALALWWVNDKGGNRRISFGEMKELTDRTAAYFSSLGIGSGDMVMLILKRRLEFWLSVLALHKIGAITIPATHMLTSKDIVYRNRKAHIKAIVCVGDTYVLEQVEKASQQYAVNQILVSVGPEVPAGYHDWHAEWKDVPLPLNLQRVSGGTDTMLAYFTSGTSGEPKLVAHDYLYALGHLTTGVFWHHLHPGSIHLTVADTGWGKAAWGKLYGQWIAGATVFVYDQERFDACRMMEAIERYRITSFCAPPTVYRFMVHEDMSRYDLSSLEHCTTAGEALNASVFDKFKAATGLSLYEGFGQTETTMTLGTMPWVTPKPGSMGLPNPQYDIDLIKPDGTSCQNGEQGEIIVRTDNVIPMGLFKGYYGDDALTRQVWHDGVYHTGDLAWRDEDGYYWFVGRTDDVIKSSGYRIGPFEVESALMTHPSVVECAVTGVPDPFRGYVVKATIVLKQEWKDKAGDGLVKELQEHVKKETAPYKYPRIVEFVEELPKTISGKIRRVEIRQQDESSYKDV
ncbi:MAG: AMP-binding protein [Prevotellaceae bacterium]|nr:AMP-binding protein [Prevotellaceae bacterium]